MKILLLGIFVCFSLSVTAQQLSEEAKKLEKDYPEVFESIRDYASSRWENDSEEIIYEINAQSEAFSEICQLIINDFSKNRHCLEVIKRRTEDDKKVDFTEPSINWKEVLFEIRQEVNIKTAY